MSHNVESKIAAVFCR